MKTFGTDRHKYVPATILTASTKSAEIDLGGGDICGFILPGTWTGTALTFEVTNTTGGTYVPLYDGVSGSAVSVTVAQSRAYSILPSTFAGWRYVKIVSDAAANGDAGRTVILAVRDIK